MKAAPTHTSQTPQHVSKEQRSAVQLDNLTKLRAARSETLNTNKYLKPRKCRLLFRENFKIRPGVVLWNFLIHEFYPLSLPFVLAVEGRNSAYHRNLFGYDHQCKLLSVSFPAHTCVVFRLQSKKISWGSYIFSGSLMISIAFWLQLVLYFVHMDQIQEEQVHWDVFSVIVLSFLRNFIIALKHSSLSDEFVDRRQRRNGLTRFDIRGCEVLFGWIPLFPDVAVQSVRETMMRLRINPFLPIYVEADSEQCLTSYLQMALKYQPHLGKYIVCVSHGKKLYSIPLQLLVLQIVLSQSSESKRSRTGMAVRMTFTFLSSVLLCFLPIILRLSYGASVLGSFTASRVIVLSCMFYTFMIAFHMFIPILIAHALDFKRRYFFLRCCTFLLETRRKPSSQLQNQLGDRNFHRTSVGWKGDWMGNKIARNEHIRIDFANQKSITAWLTLREWLHNLGWAFHVRTGFVFSAFVVFMVVFIVVLLVHFVTGFVSLNPYFLGIVEYYVSIIGICLVAVLIYGHAANHTVDLHVHALLQIRMELIEHALSALPQSVTSPASKSVTPPASQSFTPPPPRKRSEDVGYPILLLDSAVSFLKSFTQIHGFKLVGIVVNTQMVRGVLLVLFTLASVILRSMIGLSG